MSVLKKEIVGWVVIYRNDPAFKGCDEYLKVGQEKRVGWLKEATIFTTRDHAEEKATEFKAGGHGQLDAEVVPIYQETRLVEGRPPTPSGAEESFSETLEYTVRDLLPIRARRRMANG